MESTGTSFAKKIIGNTSFAVLDQILFKVGTTISFILLVRLLGNADIVAIGVAMGYLVLISYFDVGLTRVLLRDYPKIREDRTRRDEYLTAFSVFWVFQTAVILSIAILIQEFIFSKLSLPGLSFLFLGMTIEFIALVFQDWIKTVFYADFQQKIVTKIGFALTISRLSALGILVVSPSLSTYTWILIGYAVVSGLVWGTALQLRFQYRPVFTRSIPGILKQAMTGYVIWDHLNRMVIDTLLTIDTVVLSLFGYLDDIGNYAIALKVNSLLFLIPWQLSRSLQVSLANSSGRAGKAAIISTFLKVNGVVSVCQLLVILIAGDWLLRLLFGSDISNDAVLFTIIIASGVSIMNFGWPLVAVINNMCKLRNAFIAVFLPVGVIGCLIYIGMALMWGAVGIAYGNIIVYAILLVGLIGFVMRYHPYALNFWRISSQEKRILIRVVKGW